MCIALALVLRESFPVGKDLLVCAVAGVLGAFGITMLYRGLAIGRMGIVAPVTGVLAAVIPVVAGFLTEGIPAPIVLVGIVLAVVAVVLVSRVADETGRPRRSLRSVDRRRGDRSFRCGHRPAQRGRRLRGSRDHPDRAGRAVVVIAVAATRSAWRPGSLLLPLVADRRPRHRRKRLLPRRGPDRAAGHRIGPLRDVPGRDSHPRRSRAA